MTGEVDIGEGLHSEFGPSASEIWMNCPGSILACRGLPNQPTEYAAEGTAAHTLSDWARRQALPVKHWKGTVLKVGDYTFKVGKAMIEGVQTFVDSCAAIPGDPGYEELVHYESVIPGGFGTSDDTRCRPEILVITDLKFGKGVKVFAKENPQLRLYGVGNILKLDWLYHFKKVIMRICQPRLHHFEEDEISVGHLMQWAYDEARPAAARALLPGQPFKAGAWCRFCKRKDTCDTRAAYKAVFQRGSVEEEFVDPEAK